MAAHSAPSTRRQLRTTTLTSFATALAVVGLMFLGSALSSPSPGRGPEPLGTTTGQVALVDAPTDPAAPASTPSTTPAVRKSEAPRTSAKPTTTKKPTTTTTTTTRTTD